MLQNIILLYFCKVSNLQATFSENVGFIIVEGLVPNRKLKFDLKNIHFHTPSEHAIDGQKESIEAHFVHALDETLHREYAQNSELNRLVIGVLFNCTHKNENFFLKSLRIRDLQEATIYLNGFLKTAVGREVYYYEGSLTTPNCDEVVNWFVMQRPQYCTKEQLQEFTSKKDNCYRNLKPINARRVFDVKLE